MQINLATLIIAFFATSAIAHFWALVAGAFERYWFWYWRQLDDCFAWWRWLEYGFSASIMAMTMGITLGIREQYALSGLFMLTFATQTYGFLTEFFARPKAYFDPSKVPSNPTWEYAEVTEYHSKPSVLYTISQTEWATEASLFDPKTPQRPAGLKRASGVACARWWPQTLAWANRMVPHIFGYFTQSSVFFILIAQLENAKRDLDEVSDRKMPEWVEAAIYGSFAIFFSFAAVQAVFQRLAPGDYWGERRTPPHAPARPRTPPHAGFPFSG